MKKRRKFTKSKIVEKLWTALALLQEPREIRLLLEDLLYPSEVSMLGQRLLVATLIRQGFDYRSIIKTTGASVGTIQRVSDTMYRGTGGYELALSTLAQERERAQYHKQEYSKSPEERYISRRLRRGK